MEEAIVSTLPPKSILHYWLQLVQVRGQDFIRLLDYLSERDLGLLDLALSERSLRQLYHTPLRSYFAWHEVVIKSTYSDSHLNWIQKRGLDSFIQKIEICTSKPYEVDFEHHNLRLLGLTTLKCWFIDPYICRILSIYCRRLRRLEILNGIDTCSDRSFQSIFAQCRQLTYLYIARGLGNASILRDTLILLARYCKALQVLILVEMNLVNCSSIACLSELTDLKILDLDSIYSDCSFPITVFDSNSKLVRVQLKGYFSHGTVMRALGAHCHLLRYVAIFAACSDVLTDDSVISLITGCPLLELIDINWLNGPIDEDFDPAMSVTNAAMYAIAHYCPRLKTFRISSEKPLFYSDNGLDAIKYGCPLIKAIHNGFEQYFPTPSPDVKIGKV